MMRVKRILPLLATLFALRAPVWAAQAKTAAVESGEAVSVGNPLSSSGSQSLDIKAGMSAPALLPSLQTPVGSPKVQETTAKPSPLPLLAPEQPKAAPQVLQPPALPQSQLQPVTLSQPASQTLHPAPQGAQAVPGGGSEVLPRTPGSAEEGRGPPAEEPALIQRARRYIREIMGSRTPTEAETESLLQDYMEMRNLSPTSAQGRQLRGALLASKLKAEAEAVSQLDPRYKAVGPAILAAAKEYGVTAAYVEAAVKKRGLDGLLAGTRSKEQAVRILDSVLARDRFDRFLAKYPAARQGELMREVANNLLVRSGKSIEEVSRDGVFVYADFHGRSLTNASVGRDPDPQWPNVLFYVRFDDNKWRIDVYRQNRGRGFPGGQDSEFVEAFQQWLISGGVPPSDFLSR